MKKRIIIIAVLLVSFLFIGCKDEDEITPNMKHKLTENIKLNAKSVPFKAPPASTIITQEKAKQYANASVGLFRLGEKWSDKIEKAENQDKIKILDSYAAAREQVCIRIGLAGLKEFDWLQKVALHNLDNKAVFESVGVKVP